MKENILKAIDKGLMNVLSTDITVQDIDFNTSDINNEYNPEISLDELYDMFNENNESIFNTKYDTTNAISLILDDDSEISLYQYEEGMNPIFIKISNDDLKKGNNEILIYVHDNHLVTNKKWQTYNRQIQNNLNTQQIKPGDLYKDIKDKDFNGYKNCKRIFDIIKNNRDLGGEIPAIDYCLKQNVNRYYGYLPSSGQLWIITEYLTLINYILQKTESTTLDLTSGWWWSSTEYSYGSALGLYKGKIDNYNKAYDNFVLPVFIK